MDYPKLPELLRIASDEALANQKALTVNVIERDGTDANLLMASIAAMGEEVIGQIIDSDAGHYLDAAKRDRLRRRGFDGYGEAMRVAAPARGVCSFSTTAPVATSFSIPVNTVLTTADGRQYLTTTANNFLAGTTGPVNVEVRSTLAGAAQQAAAGTITAVVSRITGAPADLVVTNPLATAGAADAEDEEAYRARCRLIYRTLRRGTKLAIETAALRVPGVVTARSIPIVDATGRPMPMVQLFVTDRFTSALIQQAANPPAYQTQSQAFARYVWSQIQESVCDGVFVQVLVAQVRLVSIILQLRYVAGFDTAFTATLARATIVQRVNRLRTGETLLAADLLDALRTVPGLSIQGDEIVSPAGDVVPAALECLRTDLSLVQTSVQDADASQLNVPAQTVT